MTKIKDSFLRATKGQESIKNLIFWLIAFLPLYFISQKFLFKVFIISTIVKAINIVFLMWHIFVIFRCKPKVKKDKLYVKKLSKSFVDKLLLRKPWIDLKITTFLILVDMLLLLNLA